jgi:F0F1-type ATP synthase assembly protein I
LKIRAQIIGISFMVGMTIGIVVGRITDNMGLWIAIGSIVGIMAGAVITMVRTSENGE